MLYGVRLVTNAYRNGSIEIDGRFVVDIAEELLFVPVDNRLPETIKGLVQ